MRIAIVDDDMDSAELAADMLALGGYKAEIFEAISGFKKAVQRETFDIVLLDWMMPDASGIEVLKWLRTTDTPDIPVIMISAKVGNPDVAEALDAGADDYVTKPIDKMILLSRVKAVARRSYGQAQANTDLVVKKLKLAPASERAWIDGEAIELTSKEFQLAYWLLSNPGRPFSRGYLLEKIWAMKPNVVTRTLDAHISNIRVKLQLRPQNGFQLRTVYGYGYRLEIIADLPQ